MENKQPGKLYKVLSTTSTVGLFLTIGILVVGLFQGFLSAATSLILSIFTIVFAGCVLSLVWINNIENKRYFKTSVTFLVFTILCCILWIIAAVMIYIMFTKSKANANYNPVVLLNFVKVAFIISIQFVVANIITRNVIKYKKTYIAFQIIMYISSLFIDFYVTMFAVALKFTANDGVSLNKSISSVLFSGAMITMLILFAVYIAIANSVLNGIQTKRSATNRNRRRGLLGTLVDNLEQGVLDEVLPEPTEVVEVEEVPAAPQEEKDTPQERLTKLKELYDSNLITEEEYNTKRSEILKEM